MAGAKKAGAKKGPGMKIRKGDRVVVIAGRTAVAKALSSRLTRNVRPSSCRA